MEFQHLNKLLEENFERITKNHMLFETDAEHDKLWETYIESFPEGTNPIYRTRREYDCSCCRHFLYNIGGAVYFDDDLEMHSIFEFDTGSDTFQPVMDALAAYVRTRDVISKFIRDSKYVGDRQSRELDPHTGVVKTYNHFALTLPENMVFSWRRRAATANTIATERSQFRDTFKVFKRSLEEISLDAIATVNELISSNTLYKGEEWASAIMQLRRHKTAYDQLPAQKRDAYCWVATNEVGNALGRIRNHSIGVLLTDISGGMELDAAVRRYEKIVAPANYKRPKAIFTKKMLEQAQQTVQELGYMESLPRRFATLDDITVNNILFSNRDAAKRITGGDIFEQMKQEADTVNPKKFSRVDSIGIDKFISDVLPTAREVEVLLEGRHAPNMVSLIAPANPDAKTMFKWENGFSWAYAGNMTDSDIRENVKSAGGSVDGVLRFSIQWNDDEYDGNDLDAHCREPGDGAHIYYQNKVSRITGGSLDVDIINPIPGKPAVENITYPSKARMIPGTYQFCVHCFTNRGGKGGFRAEIEFDGQVYRYDYRKPMNQNQMVAVATVILDKNGNFTIEESLNSDMSNVDIWGVKANQFVPVSVIMYSPNFWNDQQGIGHKHYMFMLKGCKNPECPNGFYNEFLRNELTEHKRVLEALGSKMAVADAEDQLSGVGFSSTKRNNLIVRVKGSTERVMKVEF